MAEVDLTKLIEAQDALGPSEVETKDVRMKAHNIVDLQKVVERNTTFKPTISNLGYQIGRPARQSRVPDDDTGCCD